MNWLKRGVFWHLALFVLASLKPAYATVELTLFANFNGGSVSYAGGNSPLQGSLSSYFVFNNGPCSWTPGPNAPGCSSSSNLVAVGSTPFMTGPITGTDQTDWFFGPGGSLNMTGYMFAAGNGNVLIPSTTLLTGTFLNTTTLTCNPGINGPPWVWDHMWS